MKTSARTNSLKWPRPIPTGRKTWDYIALSIVTVFVTSCVSVQQKEQQQAARQAFAANWSKLRVGMSETEVHNLTGLPVGNHDSLVNPSARLRGAGVNLVIQNDFNEEQLRFNGAPEIQGGVALKFVDGKLTDWRPKNL